jgi:N-acetylglucosamine kinase-like BadF-type ATPase
MTREIVLAVDGGNSKTDLALVAADGSLLALARGPRSSPHHLGLDGCLDVLAELLDGARRDAGLDGRVPLAAVAEILAAGVDYPAEEDRLRKRVEALGWAERTIVANDTFAVLRAGTERGWGVAVVCGAGINCVGVSPDGRHVRFPALGPISGDWGGGGDVGRAALFAAARSEDGRGPKTSLEHAAPAHFGLASPAEVAEAIHLGRLEERRLVELAPLVLAEATRDAVAAEIVERLAAEVVGFVRATLTRLELSEESVDVLLGGGLMRRRDPGLLASIERGLAEVSPRLSVHVAASPPIVGAALLGLDELGADTGAQARLRRELTAAVEGLEREAGVATVAGGTDG